MTTYRHNIWVYFFIPFIIGLEAYAAYSTWTFPGELKGGEYMRYGLTGISELLAVLTSYLFLRFAIVRYYVIEEDLMVKGLFSTKVRGWDELGILKVNPNLKYLSVRDKDGKLVVFSSTDYFKDVQEFIDEIKAQIIARNPVEPGESDDATD